jgi:hypothetical protein
MKRPRSAMVITTLAVATVAVIGDGRDGQDREDGGCREHRASPGQRPPGQGGRPAGRHPPTRDFSTVTMTGARIASP